MSSTYGTSTEARWEVADRKLAGSNGIPAFGLSARRRAMAGKNGVGTSEKREDVLPRPRFGWLALFQILIIALVVLMARETRGLSEPPTPSATGPWGGRGWLAALVAMGGALLLMLPVAWAYVATRMRKQMDVSV